ncbi:MAG: hypothetical protein KA144_02140 [Xanthomonadaceae bacterium]|nr:hypothetical protein [Xanthomonadaceae bacterium]MBP7622403.1 hypothetical protein [Xanthomonadales bacterium]
MTIRTAEIENEVVDRLTAGEPLAAVLRSPGMPKPSTWYDWCAADEALSGRVARARTHGADAIAADCLEIADNIELGAIEEFERVLAEADAEIVPTEEMTERLVLVSRRVEDMLGHRKLRIETRLKLLRCWDPKNYGDKLEVESKGTLGVAVTIQRLADGPAVGGQDGESEPA